MNPNVKEYLKILINISIAIMVFCFIVFAVPKILIFFMPFLIGWIVSLIANPPVKFLAEKLKIKRKAGSAFVIIFVIAAVILMLYGIGLLLTRQLIGFIESLPETWENMEADFKTVGNQWNIFFGRLPIQAQEAIVSLGENMGEYVGKIVEKVSTPTMNAIGNFAKNIPSFIISFIMTILSSYFFVAEKNAIISSYKKWIPENIRVKWELGIHSMQTAVGGYFIAQFKIEIWMYILVVIGLLFLQVPYAFLIAIAIAFLDLLPFFGTGTIMVPWAIISFISAEYTMTIGLLIIWGVGQIVRQLIQPKIVGDSIGMKPIPTLFLLYIGFKLGSVLGMIFAIPIGIIILNLNEAGVFDTPKNSVRLLLKKLNHFRKFDEKELASIGKKEKKNLESNKRNEKK